MYTHYARDRGWKVEDIAFSPGTMGGFKDVTFGTSGDGVWQHLRYESGGHRVQRVPETEQQGRIHTSSATVAVLPAPDAVQVDITESDIEWERMPASSAWARKAINHKKHKGKNTRRTKEKTGEERQRAGPSTTRPPSSNGYLLFVSSCLCLLCSPLCAFCGMSSRPVMSEVWTVRRL